MAVLVVVEPDLGTAMVICPPWCAARRRRQHAAPADALAGLAALAMIAAVLEPRRGGSRVHRPWADPEAAASVGAGDDRDRSAFFGVGLGESVQKLFYCQAHTDMILAVIGEEPGSRHVGCSSTG
jgi:cell division protein FtsW (lipid II flippase)